MGASLQGQAMQRTNAQRQRSSTTSRVSLYLPHLKTSCENLKATIDLAARRPLMSKGGTTCIPVHAALRHNSSLDGSDFTEVSESSLL
jgi:hypothetical protein